MVALTWFSKEGTHPARELGVNGAEQASQEAAALCVPRCGGQISRQDRRAPLLIVKRPQSSKGRPPTGFLAGRDFLFDVGLVKRLGRFDVPRGRELFEERGEGGSGTGAPCRRGGITRTTIIAIAHGASLPAAWYSIGVGAHLSRASSRKTGVMRRPPPPR